MLTFRQFLIIGMLVALCSCSSSKKIVTSSNDTALDIRSLVSQIDSASKILDASGLRIELRYSSSDPHDVPSTGAVSNGGYLPEVVITADSVHLRSTDVFRVRSLESADLKQIEESCSSKFVHNLSYKFLLIIAFIILVVKMIKRLLNFYFRSFK